MRIRVSPTRELQVAARIAGIALLAVALAPPAAAQFPAAGIDQFISNAPLAVQIGNCATGGSRCANNADCTVGDCNFTRYSGRGVDPATTVGRSATHTQGSASDTGGTTVPITGCAACDPTVADSDLACKPLAPPNPAWQLAGLPEVHTEILSLELCGPCNPDPTKSAPCIEICYKAGQPAFAALAALAPPQTGKYRNSYGEIERLIGAPQSTDFPAKSFFDVKGVVTIDTSATAGIQGPAGTSGVFLLRNFSTAAATLLMVRNSISQLPPHNGTGYTPEPGNTAFNQTVANCGVLPMEIEDASAAGGGAGRLLDEVFHVVGPPSTPTLQPWGLALFAVLLGGLAVLIVVRISRGRRVAAS